MTPLPPPIPSATTLSLPADQFYWSVLDASVLPRPNRSPPPEQLGYLFEQVLPVPIDQVHAVYVRINRIKHLACGMDRSRLAEIIGASREQDLLELGPESIPELDRDLAGAPPHSHSHPFPDSINLLTGAFEPKPVSRLKNRWFMQVAALIALVTMLGILGLERRTRQLDGQVTQIQQVQAETYRQVLGKQAMGATAQPASLQLTAQLRRLRQTRQSGAGEVSGGGDWGGPSPNSLIALSRSHRSCQSGRRPVAEPAAYSCRPSRSSSRPAPSPSEASCRTPPMPRNWSMHFTRSGLPGWQSQQPQMNASSTSGGTGGAGVVQVSLQWRSVPPPTASNTPASPPAAVVQAPGANP